MKEQFIKDLKEQDIVSTTFLVVSIQRNFKKDQSPYLTLVLRDRSGDIEAKIWDEVERYEKLFSAKDIVKVNARVVRYREKLQLQINDIYRMPKEAVSMSDYLPSTPFDAKKQFKELTSILKSIKDPNLKKLAQALLKDTELMKKFKTAPAAATVHHAYIGGLLDHTLSTMKLADKTAAHYPFLNRDLLLMGAFLHDIGKTEELSGDGLMEYTDSGKLVGHLVQGCTIIDRKISNIPDFPNELAVLLKHLILSHHGHKEFGSPQVPKTPEAMALHLIDLIDSKLEAVRMMYHSHSEENGRWTAYNRQLEREFYLYDGFEADFSPTIPQEPRENAQNTEKMRILDLFGQENKK